MFADYYEYNFYQIQREVIDVCIRSGIDFFPFTDLGFIAIKRDTREFEFELQKPTGAKADLDNIEVTAALQHYGFSNKNTS